MSRSPGLLGGIRIFTTPEEGALAISNAEHRSAAEGWSCSAPSPKPAVPGVGSVPARQARRYLIQASLAVARHLGPEGVAAARAPPRRSGGAAAAAGLELRRSVKSRLQKQFKAVPVEQAVQGGAEARRAPQAPGLLHDAGGGGADPRARLRRAKRPRYRGHVWTTARRRRS